MHIISDGAKNYKNTEAFKNRKKQIIREVNLKYDSLLVSEENFFEKLKLHFSKKKEVLERLAIIYSKEILFFKD